VSRPNILLIIADDQRFDQMTFMPKTMARIFGEGIRFEHGYVTTPQCCPSRSSMLTGLYAHNHGVTTNKDELTLPTFVARLHASGYYTGLVGKYLNSYPATEAQGPLPEFDFWVASSDATVEYYDPLLNVNGPWQSHTGYLTYLLRDYALDFLEQAQGRGAPFLLIFAPRAPHRPAQAGPGDGQLYADLPPSRPASFDEADLSDKPAWLQELAPLTDKDIQRIDADARAGAQALHALDETVESLYLRLKAEGLLGTTLVIYISDNGVAAGEHRLPSGKILGYEEMVHVPFAVRYPPLVPVPRVDTAHLVANIDIAPTLYDLAGILALDKLNGLSLVPLLTDSAAPWRSDLLIEGWPEQRKENSPHYTAIRTERYIYIETDGDLPELYDMDVDPLQMENRAADSAYAEIVADLKQRLAVLRLE
jgi:arylsulfatase A-like enzyme